MGTRPRLFTGSGVALVTPFTKENTVDRTALKNQAAFHIHEGTDALIVCGTTGEGSTMSPSERAEATSAVVQAANGRIPVIAGVGGNDTRAVIAACRDAEKAGADAVLAVTPYYNKTTQAGLIAHYEAVADDSALPIILYNVPSRTGLNMQAETAARLAAHENIIATKEASGDISQIADIARLCGAKLDIYSGNDTDVLAVLALGGAGVISTAANVVPERMHRLCAAFEDGLLDEARAIQLQLMPLIHALFAEVNPIPVKEAMMFMGFPVGALRLPLVPLSEKNRETLKACMKEMKLI
ncbi:MAG: 4-hydroxy-tetrahydrodipicolinate synthase [Clostridia bacterium]|nr:4-hydroxy-tetrahydrodipicolinate synthase [Clostridia bacterium]